MTTLFRAPTTVKGLWIPRNWRTVLVVLFVVIVVLPCVAYLAVPWGFSNLYFRHVRLPDYERALGFEVGRVCWQGHGGDCCSQAGCSDGIAVVVPGGTLARIGFRSGDLVRYEHGFEVGFYADLEQACRESAVLRVLNANDEGLGEKFVRVLELKPSDLPSRLCS